MPKFRKLPCPLCFSSGKGYEDLDLNTYSSKLPGTLGPLAQLSPSFALFRLPSKFESPDSKP